MSDAPTTSTHDLAIAEYDAGHRARSRDALNSERAIPDDASTNEPLPVAGEDADVGLSQKGSGEDAIVKRETEI